MPEPMPKPDQVPKPEDGPQLRIVSEEPSEPARTKKKVPRKKPTKKRAIRKKAKKSGAKKGKPKKRVPRGRTSDADIADRVEQVREWYNTGILFGEIKKRAREAWDVSSRTTQDYLARARELNVLAKRRTNDELLELSTNLMLQAFNDPNASPETKLKTAVKLAEVNGVSKEVKGGAQRHIHAHAHSENLPKTLPKVTREQLESMSTDKIAELHRLSMGTAGIILEAGTAE